MIKATFSRLNPFLQLIVILCLILVSIFITYSLAVIIALPFTGMSSVKNLLQGNSSIAFLKYLQIIQGFAIFIIPSFTGAWLFSKKPSIWLKFKKVNTKLILLSILCILTSLPFVSWLGVINTQLSLPDSLLPILNWMQETENTTNQLIFKFLDTKNLNIILFNILMIAIIPALGEEMLFRGVIQNLINKMVENHHLAIWITAFLFSAMHMQFLTFAPRFFLGAILGYLLIYGGSIWYPIVAHFFNNLSSLIIFYFYRVTRPNLDPFNPDINNQTFPIAIMSLIVTIGIIYLFKKWDLNNKTMKS